MRDASTDTQGKPIYRPTSPIAEASARTSMRVDARGGQKQAYFQDHQKQLPVPYIIYANFEVLTIKIAGPELDPGKSNTRNPAA